MKLVYDAVLDLFSIFFSLDFFKTCLTCKNKNTNEKNYERAESEETKKDKKDHIEKQTRMCKASFIYDVRKKPKFRILTPFSFLSTNIEFLSK